MQDLRYTKNQHKMLKGGKMAEEINQIDQKEAEIYLLLNELNDPALKEKIEKIRSEIKNLIRIAYSGGHKDAKDEDWGR
jgi:hypothetical protein